MTRVLMVGGGHAHLVAAPLVAAGAGGASIALLAPSPRLLYSGMMPGWLAGRHAFDDCAIDLRRVALAAGIEWIEDAALDLDLGRREVLGSSGRRHRFDLLSLNVGSENPVGGPAPVAPTVLGAKPFEAFVAGWAGWRAAAPPAPRCVVVGGGAAAVEIAFALAARRGSGGPSAGGTVALVTAGDRLLPGMSRIAAALAAGSLARRGIAVHLGLRYVGAAAGLAQFLPDGSVVPGAARGRPAAVVQDAADPPAAVRATACADAARVCDRPTPGDRPGRVDLPADLVVLATGGRPPGWLAQAARRAGLPVRPDGGVAVDACLRSPADGRVFAAGDCASFVDGAVPKSGVHALKQGAPLAASILARLRGEGAGGDVCAAPARYVAQRRALALLDRCDGTAIAAWGPLGAAGSTFARWKDRIDRGFVARFPRGDGNGPGAV